MKRFPFLKLTFICLAGLLFALNTPAVGIEIGSWEATWTDREKEFNDYMEDYISEKTRGLQYTKRQRILTKKQYRKKEKAFKAIEAAYEGVKQESETIRALLEDIDDNFIISDAAAQLKPNRLRPFKQQTKNLVNAKKRYLKFTKKLKTGEDIDIKEVKIATKSLKHIVDNVVDQYKTMKAMAEVPQTMEGINELTRRTSIPNLQNSIAQMKYALAKVKKKPTLATWTGSNLMQQTCRDVQMALTPFRDDRRFKDARKLQQQFIGFEGQMERAIRDTMGGQGGETKAVMNAHDIINKHIKTLKKNFTRYKKSVGYRG